MNTTTTSIKAKVEGTISQCSDQSSGVPDADFLAHLRRALQSKFEGIAPGQIQNTYLKTFDIPQIILYDILANRFPLVRKAQQLVSRCILEVAQNQEQLCIIDLGIGRSVQMLRILQSLDECKSLKTVTVIGVEIQKDSLAFSTSLLNEKKNSFHYDVVFHPINTAIEALDMEVLATMIPPNCRLIANASLAMHHIQTKAARVELFNHLSALQPNLVCLIEPNVDCFTDNFETRLFNAYEHFGALYAYINTLDLKAEEKSGLKQFFSNELFDVIAIPNEYRFEKYDLSANWCAIGKASGFSNYPIDQLVEGLEIPGINISKNGMGFVNFTFGRTDILGIIILKGTL